MGMRTCGGLTFRFRAFQTWVFHVVAIAIAASAGAAEADDTAARSMPVAVSVARGSVETIWFTDRQQVPVRVVRGDGSAGTPYVKREVLTFGGAAKQRVTVLRGEIEPAVQARPQAATLRGATSWGGASAADLFSFAGGEEFDRIADAVHGVESRYGTDLRMWRLDDPGGPQGPMQVSAAAAFDVGGGNRFDVSENILLGRAYLARLFRRYGSWSDALAAYNWGPGNVDQWIARGRRVEQLPAETARYIERVLRQALVGSAAGVIGHHASKRNSATTPEIAHID